MTAIAFSIPIRTIPLTNSREHPGARIQRVRKEREVVFYTALEAGSKRWASRILPCTVTLTRRGVLPLDSDNLPASMKTVRDQLAEILGLGKNDADPRVTWVYAEAPAERKNSQAQWAVDVRIEPREDAAAAKLAETDKRLAVAEAEAAWSRDDVRAVCLRVAKRAGAFGYTSDHECGRIVDEVLGEPGGPAARLAETAATSVPEQQELLR